MRSKYILVRFFILLISFLLALGVSVLNSNHSYSAPSRTDPSQLGSTEATTHSPAHDTVLLADPSSPRSLRHWADQRGIAIGSAVFVDALTHDKRYGQILAAEFNSLTPENAMKFSVLSPAQGQYHFSGSDQIVDFAEAHGMQIRGHTLVWHHQLPDWLPARPWTPEEARTLLQDHIRTVVGRYRGRVREWDVVNEAISEDGSLRNTFWLQHIGPEYIELAFRWAHEADPAALLFYNDFGGEGAGTKSDSIFLLVQRLLSDSVPIHGVGLQMHVSVERSPALYQIAANMERLSELGLQIHITEMDVRVRDTDVDPIALNRQAFVFGNVLDVCLLIPNCTNFSLWGFTDRYSWIPQHFPGWGHGLILDSEFRPKPAYDALMQTLVGRF